MKILSFSVLVRPRSTKRNNGESIGFRSFSLHFPPFFLHFLLIFFFFFLTISSSTYSNTSNRNRAGSLIRELFRRHRESLSFCPVSRARDIFHIPSVFPSLRQLPSREIAIRTLERSNVGPREDSRSRSFERREDEKDAGFGSVSSSSSFFFPLPRCVSRLRSSFFFLFLFSERVFAIRLRDPWRFVLRAWTPRSSIDGERNR